MKTRCFILVSLLILVLSACRPDSQVSPLPTPGISPFSPLPVPPTNPAAAAAIAALAAELDLPAQEIAILSSEEVNWPDTSLGCPQPGMMYGQVITPGYRFRLQADGKAYNVHTDQTGTQVVICRSASGGGAAAPDAAFHTLLAHLCRMYPGFGLAPQEEWTAQHAAGSKSESSIWTWQRGDWYIEIAFSVAPAPATRAALRHRHAGIVWNGTVEANDQVTPRDELPAFSFNVGACDETAPSADEDGASTISATVHDGMVIVNQDLWYVCCAKLSLAVGRSENSIKIIETNTGEMCRCTCRYPITIGLMDLFPGQYTIEVWGVQYGDVHPLELLGSVEVHLPSPE
ncbi:MAG TPA: hypothetical protein ENN99_10905 [Chloroflexi bacterium]|nr:hypothetical protein [Chloroflexota bacterium]